MNWTPVRAVDHSVDILDAGMFLTEGLDHSTGLVVLMNVGARLYTGIDTGPVRLSASTSPTQPNAYEDIDDGWSEIVEASVHAPQGRLHIGSPDSGPTSGLPCLSEAGPGWYRLRVFARGRDTSFDAVVSEPVEDYVITAWPASPSAPTIIRATDRCGAGLRQASADRRRTRPSLTAVAQAHIDDEARLAAIRRQALLQASGQPAEEVLDATTQSWRPGPDQPTPGPRH